MSRTSSQQRCRRRCWASPPGAPGEAALRWSDLVVLAIVYALTGLGVTVGFHRLLTHRSIKTAAPLRFVLAALGFAAIEGPLIEWVSNHRKHHQFSDQDGDPTARITTARGYRAPCGASITPTAAGS
jgi:fatty-acid desaturase